LFSETQSFSSVNAVAELDMQDVFPDCPFNLDCFNDVNMLDYISSLMKYLY
jgi:hypothetical protein